MLFNLYVRFIHFFLSFYEIGLYYTSCRFISMGLLDITVTVYHPRSVKPMFSAKIIYFHRHRKYRDGNDTTERKMIRLSKSSSLSSDIP